MTKPGRALRAAFVVSSIALVILGIVTAVRILTPSDSGAGVPVGLSVVWAVLGSLWAASGIANNLTSIRASRPPRHSRDHLLPPVLLRDESLVDRIGEMQQLGSSLVGSRCVNCHGHRGTGKSHLLGYVADVVNGHREDDSSRPAPAGFKAALYFDLADAVGFDRFVHDACQARFPDATSWAQFVAAVDTEFGHKRILLMLDNVNLEGLWSAAGKAAYDYLVRRPSDAVVFGSVDPMILHNLEPAFVPVRSFDLEAVRSLARARRPDLTDADVEALHTRTGGLAIYLQLLLANEALPNRSDEAIDWFLQHHVFSELHREERAAIAHIAVLAYVRRAIAVDELSRHPIANLESTLDGVASRSLITRSPTDAAIRMHDIVRDSVVRRLGQQVSEAANAILEVAVAAGRELDGAVVALHCDPTATDIDAMTLLRSAIDDAASSRNYALLETISVGCRANAKLLGFLHDRRGGRTLVAYARAAGLAGIGRYGEAEHELLAPGVSPPHDDDALKFDFHFLLADLAHLQNRYDEAFEMFDELNQLAADRSQGQNEARCQWGLGHVLRHQGKDPQRALRHLAVAESLAHESGDIGTEVLAATNATGLRVHLEALLPDEAARLKRLEDRVRGYQEHSGDLIKVRKARARLAWLAGRRRQAELDINEALEIALRMNDRLIYNVYFERAEFARLAGEYDRASIDYERVAAFAEGNQDRNLIANCILGRALCAACTADRDDPDALRELRGSVLEARQIAMDADIQATVQQATRIASSLQAVDFDVIERTRLIVF